jgi:cobalt/nickel transport system permease protein
MSLTYSKNIPKRSHVLENTLQNIAETLERGLFAEEISLRPGLFQGLDARVKVVAILALLIGVGLSHSLWVILGVYLLALGLALASAIPADLFIRRVWLALPFFTGVLVLPALFITPGAVLLNLPLGLVITRTGVTSALFLLLRVSTSLSLTMLLILTTPWNTVLSALGVLHIPDVFILILGMTYRYILLLLQTARDMFESWQSRTVGVLDGHERRRLAAASVGVLLGKTFYLSNEIYLAMLSRGFGGEVYTLDDFQMQRQDWTALAIFIALAALAFWLGRSKAI